MIEIKLPEGGKAIIELPKVDRVIRAIKALIELPKVDLAIEAYNMGYEDGVEAYKAMMEIEKEEKEEHDGCVSCRFEDKKEYEDPCRRCSHNFTDKWEAKE